MLTRRCDIACGHCSVVSGPDVRGPEPSLEELREAVRAAALAGAGAIQLTGGEPMLRRDVALELLREARRVGIASAITTNPKATHHLRDFLGWLMGGVWAPLRPENT